MTDPATGLQGRAAAEEMIAAKISEGKEFVVTLFQIDRLAHINGRFGRKTGDEILLEVAQYVGKELNTGSLFRWTGPALVAILEIQPSLNAVQRQLKRIASMRIEKSIETDGRSVLLPITCSFLQQEVSARGSVETVAHNMDKFVGTHP